MLSIHKISPEEALQYLKTQNIPHTLGTEQFMGLYAHELLFGVGSIALEDGKVYLDTIHITEDSGELSYGLAKALLNMADLSGIKTIYGKNPNLDKLYKKLRFREENSEFTLSLTGYFTAEGHE